MAIERFRHEHFFLSNMYPLPQGIQTPDGVVVRTSEQLYLPLRLLQQEDRRIVETARDGVRAKRALNNLIRAGSPVRSDWEDIRVEKMRECIRLKFGTNPSLAEQLLATGDDELIEGNIWGDTFWGVSPPPPDGQGENMLGRILMETRDALRSPDFSIDPDTLIKRIFAGLPSESEHTPLAT